MAQYRRNIAGVEDAWRDVDYNLQVKAVCADCNNGWMSDLEMVARPYMEGVIQGHGRRFYRYGQSVLATWAIKTAMMFQARDTDDPISERHHRELYDRKAPPQDTQVWIGGFNGTGIDFHRHVTLTLDRDAHPTTSAYGSTFTVGHLIFQVFGHEVGEGARRQLSGGLGEAFTEIWPVQAEPVSWPPPVRLGLRDLEAAANAFVTPR